MLKMIDEVSEKKKKRVSKNKKKNWSKHSDIRDVEEMLVEQRRQMRTGGLMLERKDSQLFYIDKDQALFKGRNTKEKALAKGVSLIRKMGRREPRPLRCHANLVPNPLIKPARVRTNFGITDDIKKKCSTKQENLKNGIFSKKEKLQIKERKLAVKKRDAIPRDNFKEHHDKYDLWDDHDGKVVSPSKAVKPKTIVPVIEVAHPGASYNPDYDDYQDLIRKATDIEASKIKKIERLERQYAHSREHDINDLEDRYIDEMSIGLFKTNKWSDDSSEDEVHNNDDDEDRCVTGLNPPVRRENKKTPKERRKMRRQKLSERKQQEVKRQRIIKNEIFRLKSIRKEVVLNEEVQKVSRKYREEKALKVEQQTRILGKMRYEDPNMEVKLGDELRGSLRLLKPEGNLMEDRFHSLQKRNLIEPRLRAKFHRIKRKVFEKKGHQDITL